MPRETQRIEHKASLNEWHEVVETVAAFATADGGTIRIGISPRGKRVGVALGQGTLEDLTNRIKINTDPPQYPSVEIDGREDDAVITLQVERSPVKPVWAFGRPFKRVGRTNQRLSRDESKRLMEVSSGRTWDALPCEGLEPKHLLRRAVVDFLRRSGQGLSTKTDNVLETLRLTKPDGLCNGAALLFARNPQRFFSEALVKCGRFIGTTSVRFLDQQTLEGNVFDQLEAALAFVTRNTRQAIRITGRPEHEVVPEYPEEAVREAVTNAICHRDYAAVGTTQVRIYDDRLEVWNPGTLPPGLTIEQLYTEHPSLPPNRLVADAFHRARLIEHWGTGTLRIMRECDAAGLPQPEFLSDMGQFIVRFKSPVNGEHVAEAVDLNARQQRAVGYVREHGRITSSEHCDLTGIGKVQGVRDLNALVDVGILSRRGQGRAVHYVLPGSVDTERLVND